jgi:hypothetical protein
MSSYGTDSCVRAPCSTTCGAIRYMRYSRRVGDEHDALLAGGFGWHLSRCGAGAARLGLKRWVSRKGESRA